MRAILWTVSLLFLALWSLLAWGATGLLGAADPWLPGIIGDALGLGPAAGDLAGWFAGAGPVAILAIWAVGAVFLLLGTLIVSKAYGRIRGALRGGSRPPVLLPPSRHADGARWTRRLAPRLLRSARH